MSYGANQAIPDQQDQGMPSPSEFVGNANTAQAAMPTTAENAMGLQAPETAGAPPAAQTPTATNAPPSTLQPTPEGAMGLGQSAPQIARYLSGADAAPRQVVQALETKVDPQNTMDQNERSLRTIEAAAQDSPDVAWGVMQYYRSNYNALRAATAVSLAKGANPEIVAQNFNAAQSYLPDGNTVTLAPSKSGGYVVQVHTQGGASQTYDLTPEQLNQFVHPGNHESGFDNLVRPDTPDQVNQVLQQVQGSAGQTIEKLQKTGATQQTPATPARAYGGPNQNPTDVAGQQTGVGTAGAPGANNFENVQTAQPDERQTDDPFKGFDPQKVVQARYMFNGDMPKMLNFLSQNEQRNQELKNQVEASRGRGVEAATQRSEGTVQAAQTRAGAPTRQGTDTAEARNAREQSRNDTRRAVEYDKTVSGIQRDLVKQINPATNNNWTPQEAMQEALAEVKSRGMVRPSPVAQTAPPAPQVGTQIGATQNNAPAAAPVQAAPAAAPVTGRAPVKANQADVRQDAKGNLWTKDARGQVVPYQPQNQ